MSKVISNKSLKAKNVINNNEKSLSRAMQHPISKLERNELCIKIKGIDVKQKIKKYTEILEHRKERENWKGCSKIYNSSVWQDQEIMNKQRKIDTSDKTAISASDTSILSFKNQKTYSENHNTCSEPKKSSTKEKKLADQTFRTLRCKNCDEQFSEPRKLTQHIHERHAQQRLYECAICKQAFTWQTALNRHLLDHSSTNPYKCSKCDKSFALNTSLVAHEKTHKKRAAKSKSGSHPKGLGEIEIGENKKEVEKREVKHKRPRDYKCSKCMQRYKHKSDLEGHERRNNDGRRHKCNYCSKDFSHRCARREHEKEHRGKGKESLRCEKCKKNYKSESDLKYHVKHRCQKVDRSSREPKPVKSKTQAPYKCDSCGEDFESKSEFKHHARKHNQDSASQNDKCEDQKEISNKDVQNYQSDKDKLEIRTEMNHDKIVKTDRNSTDGESRQTSHKAYVTKHQPTDDAKLPVPCHFCGKIFKNAVKLKCHLTTHEEKKHCCCKKCRKSSVNDLPDVQDISSMRNETVSYQCVRCEQTFLRKTELENHQCTQNSEVKTSTEECNSDKVIKPKKIKDILKLERSHCKRCQLSFSNTSDLVKHFKTHFRELLFEFDKMKNLNLSKSQKIRIENIKKKVLDNISKNQLRVQKENPSHESSSEKTSSK